MPKIGKIRLQHSTPYHEEHEIWYKSNFGFYVKGLPSDFKGLTGLAEFYATEAGLSDALYNACRKYRELRTTTKSVIAYRCSASVLLAMNYQGGGSWSGRLPGVSLKIATTGLGSEDAQIGISFKVVHQIYDGAEYKYYKINKETGERSGFPTSFDKDWQFMDHTPEREEFFDNIVKSMQKLVVSLSKFFDKDPEEAAIFIEHNQKLLG